MAELTEDERDLARKSIRGESDSMSVEEAREKLDVSDESGKGGR